MTFVKFVKLFHLPNLDRRLVADFIYFHLLYIIFIKTTPF